MNIKITRGRVALAVAAIVIGIAGVSYAAIPATNGTISACKDNKGGLKVIDAEAGQTCAGNQQLLTWNQQGQAGAPGVSEREVVFSATGYGHDSVKLNVAHCPAGKTVLGGGAYVRQQYGNSEDLALGVVIPFSYPSGGSWVAKAYELTSNPDPWYLATYAICAKVS
jgi:hypothetical protein